MRAAKTKRAISTISSPQNSTSVSAIAQGKNFARHNRSATPPQILTNQTFGARASFQLRTPLRWLGTSRCSSKCDKFVQIQGQRDKRQLQGSHRPEDSRASSRRAATCRASYDKASAPGEKLMYCRCTELSRRSTIARARCSTIRLEDTNSRGEAQKNPTFLLQEISRSPIRAVAERQVGRQPHCDRTGLPLAPPGGVAEFILVRCRIH